MSNPPTVYSRQSRSITVPAPIETRLPFRRWLPMWTDCPERTAALGPRYQLNTRRYQAWRTVYDGIQLLRRFGRHWMAASRVRATESRLPRLSSLLPGPPLWRAPGLAP